MNYFKLLGIDIDYKVKELDENYKYLIELMSPYIDDGGNDFANRFIDIDLAHDALKNNGEKYKRLDILNKSNRDSITINHRRFINARFMLENLEGNIGKVVNVTYNKNGEIKKSSGYLESVHDFNFIKLIGQSGIHYIDNEEAIMNVTNSENKPIFINQFIRYDYNITSEDELKTLYNLLWGETLGMIYYVINKTNNRVVVNNKEVTHKLFKNKK